MGNIIIQTFEQPLFTIRYKVIEFFRLVQVSFAGSNAKLISFLALKNGIHYKMKGIGVVKLNAGQFALLHNREDSYIASFKKKQKVL